MEIIIGKSTDLIEKAHAIRYQVFTVEQKIPSALDLDGLDSKSDHALVMKIDKPIATARLLVTTDGSSVMARVAVLAAYRGCGIASILVKALMAHAMHEGVSTIEIHAHGYLRSFYERFGFEFIQEVEVVGEHQLIEMRHHIVRQR